MKLVIDIPKRVYDCILKRGCIAAYDRSEVAGCILNGTKVKTGYWVNGEYCSECGCDVPAYIVDWKWEKDIKAKYCPKCGTEMIEPKRIRRKE